MSHASSLRARLALNKILVAPSVAEPLAALIAEDAGIEAVEVGGYAMGAHLGITEPLLSVTDVAECVRRIRAVSQLPLIVDAGAGWGEPLHVMHCVRVLETAGASAIHIEDQRYPKRAHYHRGREEVITADEMVAKIVAALESRSDPDTVIIARTDAMRTDGYEEGVRRAEMYRAAGADLVMLFPNSLEETARAPRDAPGCGLMYVNSEGNAMDRPVVGAGELEEYGWSVVVNSTGPTLAGAHALLMALKEMAVWGASATDGSETRETRAWVERLIGLPQMYSVEEQTVRWE